MPDKIPDIVPKEALAWFKAKKLQPGFDFRDVWLEEHSAAFTVAKMTQLDLLNDVKELVTNALATGQTFREFQQVLEPLLVKRGWWGIRDMVDPLTNETKTVQLGSESRLRTIYDTNMRTARTAGQWQRIERTKRAMPYLIYTLGPSREHRVDHLKWANICLPVDDPFWLTHTGPNGWGCKCGIRQVSKYEYEQLLENGATQTTAVYDDNGLPTGQVRKTKTPLKTEAPPVKNVKWLNNRTGEEELIPEGIDPGWNYNPGINRQAALERQLNTKQQVFDGDS
ncbi:TPA: phage minor head protein [Yersinia enterocolitica]